MAVVEFVDPHHPHDVAVAEVRVALGVSSQPRDESRQSRGALIESLERILFDEARLHGQLRQEHVGQLIAADLLYATVGSKLEGQARHELPF